MYQAYQPDIIFMDLAMPGMDGWETINVIRNVHKSDVNIAIISANAFDRNLENDSDITAQDFLVKPVNLLDLINWISDHVSLEWVYAHVVNEDIESIEIDYQFPPVDRLESILNFVDLGYMAGIRNVIDEIEQQQQANPAFINKMRNLAQAFDIDAMKLFIETALENRLDEQ